MKFLADMGVSWRTVDELRRLGHDAVHLRDEGLQQLPDTDVHAKARQEARVVLTVDLDFGELLAAGIKRSPSVITFRMRRALPSLLTRALLEVIKEQQEALEAGAIVTVQDAHYRVRRLPVDTGEDSERR